MKRRKREVYLSPSSGDRVYLCIDTTVDGEITSKEYRPTYSSLTRLHKLLWDVRPARIDFNTNGPAVVYRFMGKVNRGVKQ